MMKKCEVIGYAKYEGEYEGKPYEGYYVFAQPLTPPENLFGHAAEKFKIKKRLGYIPCCGDILAISEGKFGVTDVLVLEQGSGFPGEGL